MDAPTAESVAERSRLATANNSGRAATEADRTYISEWNRYRTWVTQMRVQNVIPHGPKFLTRENVNLYFSECIIDRKVNPDGARRVVSALQRFANNIEYNDGNIFTIDCDAVSVSLAHHKKLYQSRTSGMVEDIHANLPTNILSVQNCEKILTLAISKRNWKDMMLCWTVCEQTFLRNDAMRKLTLRHLCCNHTHGPRSRPSDNNQGAGWGFVDNTMMCFVIQKGGSTSQKRGGDKQRHKHHRVAGAWRHIQFLKCAVGNLAMNLLMRLGMDTTIHFYAAVGDPLVEYPFWQDELLITKWSGRTSPYDAFCKLYDEVGCSWAKVTHLRKLGIEHATSRGELNSFEVKTMSKHTSGVGKLENYQTELFAPVCRVQSGHQKNDSYWVPRTRLFPFSELAAMAQAEGRFHGATDPLEISAILLYPHILEWRQQSEGPGGDKTSTARNFLFETLPYLAVVAIQDGIFWIRQFPDHEVTRRLLHVMPPWYPGWAAWARHQCQHMTMNRAEEQLQAMGTATCTAFTVLQGRHDERDKIDRIHRAQQQDAIRVQQEAIRVQQEGMSQMHNSLLHFAERLNEVQSAVPGNTTALVPGPAKALQENLRHAALPLEDDPPIHVQTAQPNPQKRNMNNLLRNIPRRPAVPRALPASLQILLQEHLDLDLASFHNSSRHGWNASLLIAFNKRKHLYEYIVNQAKNHTGEHRLQQAARKLDGIRGTRTVSAFYSSLRNEDRDRKTRKRKANVH